MARGKQILAFVPVTVNNFKYGFRYNEANFNAYGALLGMELVGDTIGVFFGGNSPKPPKAKRKFASSTVQGFFDISKRRQLLSAGWTINNGDAAQGIRNSGRYVTVAVDTPATHGYQYAWNIPVAERDRALQNGAVIPTDPDKLVWGSFPKPPRYSKKESDGNHSSFMPPDLALINAAILRGYSVEAPDPDWGLAA